MKNIDTFSKALGDASSGLHGAVSGIGEIGRKIGPLAGRLEKLTDDADKLLGAVDAAKVRKSVDDLAGFAASLGAKDGPTQHALADAATLVKHLNDTAAKLDTALADLDGVAKAFDAKKVGELMDGAAAVGETLAGKSRQSRQHAEERRRAHRQAQRFRRQDRRTDDQRAGLPRLARHQEGRSASSATRRSRSGCSPTTSICAFGRCRRGLVKFSGSGLKEYEEMAVDARKTLSDIDRVIRSIEKNPTQLIFGSK